MKTLKEALEYAMSRIRNHRDWESIPSIIMSNGERYVAGTWEEKEYAESYGFKFIGTVAELYKNL